MSLFGLPSVGRINAEVRRIGGGYGGKITNPIPIASAAATAALRFNRPVRIVLDIETNIEMCSGRIPYLINYDVRAAWAHQLTSWCLETHQPLRLCSVTNSNFAAKDHRGSDFTLFREADRI